MQVFDVKPPGGRLFSERRGMACGRLRRQTQHKKFISRARGKARGSGRDGGCRLDGATRWMAQVTSYEQSSLAWAGDSGVWGGEEDAEKRLGRRDPLAGRPVRNLHWGVPPVARGEGWHPLKDTKPASPSRSATRRSRPCVGSLLRGFPFRGSCAAEGVGGRGQRARQDARGKGCEEHTLAARRGTFHRGVRARYACLVGPPSTRPVLVTCSGTLGTHRTHRGTASSKIRFARESESGTACTPSCGPRTRGG